MVPPRSPTERCDGLRDKLIARFESGMRECKEKETRRGRVDPHCFQKVRAKFNAASGKATVYHGCRHDTAAGIMMPPLGPPTDRKSTRLNSRHVKRSRMPSFS